MGLTKFMNINFFMYKYCFGGDDWGVEGAQLSSFLQRGGPQCQTLTHVINITVIPWLNISAGLYRMFDAPSVRCAL